MSEKIAIVQEIFSAIYHIDLKYFNTHQTFDYLFKDHEHFKIGEMDATIFQLQAIRQPV